MITDEHLSPRKLNLHKPTPRVPPPPFFCSAEMNGKANTLHLSLRVRSRAASRSCLVSKCWLSVTV